jgi:hypothetical protein
MDTTHLNNAKKIYGFSLDFALKGNKLLVANDGFITDNAAEITAKKHSGSFNGLFYQYTKKGYKGELIAVIRAITEQGVTA